MISGTPHPGRVTTRARRAAAAPVGGAGDPTGLEWLAARGRVVSLPRDSLLCDDDTPPGFGGVLLEGFLRIQRYGLEGRRQIVSLVHPGEFLGEPFLNRGGYSVEAASPVRLLRVERGVFERMLAEDDTLRHLACVQTATRLERLRFMIWAIGALSTEERYCAFLALAGRTMALRHGSAGTEVQIAIPRRDIADLLATSVETICRLNKKLARAGLIAPVARDRLHLADPSAIAARGHVAGALDGLVHTGLDGAARAALAGRSRADIPGAAGPAMTPVNDPAPLLASGR